VRSPFRAFAAALVAVGGVLLALSSSPAAAHTESDLVAVAAGSQATVTLRPTHGCDGSPTIEVAIRAPVPGATAGEVAGWTATATPDGNGRTVLMWTGGSLPATTDGAFPVAFVVPETPGALLTFPAVQRCANGAELAWINGDPEADNPAPRLLVLSAGSEPASTIDDVPADAPGRDQLVAIVDVDNPGGTTTTAAPTTTAPATAAPTTSTAATTAAPGDADDGDSEDGGSSSAVPIVIGAAAIVGVGAGGFALLRRRG
jgi:uncharacterized protein YcnI